MHPRHQQGTLGMMSTGQVGRFGRLGRQGRNRRQLHGTQGNMNIIISRMVFLTFLQVLVLVLKFVLGIGDLYLLLYLSFLSTYTCSCTSTWTYTQPFTCNWTYAWTFTCTCPSMYICTCNCTYIYTCTFNCLCTSDLGLVLLLVIMNFCFAIKDLLETC